MAKIAYADHIRVGYCGECDGLHIQYHDENDNVIAVAVLDKQQAVDLGEECEAFVRDGAAVRASAYAKKSGRLQ